MQVSNHVYSGTWDTALNSSLDNENTLVMVFGTSKKDKISQALQSVITTFPNSVIIGASSAGEISQDELLEDSLVVAVLAFDNTRIKKVSRAVSSASSSIEEGAALAKSLLADDLKGIIVLSDGLNINGSQLTKGINTEITPNIVVTGGLAGDDDRFANTWVLVDGEMQDNYVTAVGLYGEDIHIAHGSKSGWDKLGPSRTVTRAVDNVLYEIDNQPALGIYKRYLGDKASGLPATGLLYPLELEELSTQGDKIIRTILGVNEQEQSITFAGDIPNGSYVTLMRANYDGLVDGANDAAEAVDLTAYNNQAICCLAISCVGRRLVLKQRTEEELEATLDVLPEKTVQVGFYSYGEISPLANGRCDLHNQTMTLTLLWEGDA